MSTRFDYSVSVTAETQEQANRVMEERVSHDEDHGFDYSIYVAAPQALRTAYGERGEA